MGEDAHMTAEEFDENGNLIEVVEDEGGDEASNGERNVNMCKDPEEEDRDRFAAFVDPDVVEKFILFTGLRFEAPQDLLFFLMTFPYYEHEWDLFGYLLECVF